MGGRLRARNGEESVKLSIFSSLKNGVSWYCQVFMKKSRPSINDVMWSFMPDGRDAWGGRWGGLRNGLFCGEKTKLWTFLQYLISCVQRGLHAQVWHASRSPRVCLGFSLKASLLSSFLSGPVDPREVTTSRGQLVLRENRTGEQVTVFVAHSWQAKDSSQTCSLGWVLDKP